MAQVCSTRKRRFTLTPAEMRDVLSVESGADILDQAQAARLREIDQRYPGLLLIVKPRYEYGPKEKRAYFGCKLNPLVQLCATVTAEARS